MVNILVMIDSEYFLSFDVSSFNVAYKKNDLTFNSRFNFFFNFLKDLEAGDFFLSLSICLLTVANAACLFVLSAI